MVSPEEHARRRVLKNAARQTERDQIRASLPVEPGKMRELFDFVDQQISATDCDDTLKHTLEFLGQEGLPAQPVINWLEGAGGFCDCEVLANAEDKFIFAFGEES